MLWSLLTLKYPRKIRGPSTFYSWKVQCCFVNQISISTTSAVYAKRSWCRNSLCAISKIKQNKNFSIFNNKWKTVHQILAKTFSFSVTAHWTHQKKNKIRNKEGKKDLKMNYSSILDFILVNYFFSLKHTKGWGGKCQHDSSKHYLMSKWKHQRRLTKSNMVYNFHAFHSVIIQFI